jgi:hypothetical protein
MARKREIVMIELAIEFLFLASFSQLFPTDNLWIACLDALD